MPGNNVRKWKQKENRQLFGLLVQSVKPLFVEPSGSAKGDFAPLMQRFYAAARTPRGAMLLAVFRGKASEGTDFADEFARGVVLVGVPYPNAKDERVALKKAYNDAAPAQRRLQSGAAWYALEAFRALNQALGRGLRHKNDFCALLLLDARHERGTRGTLSSVSAWLRWAETVFLWNFAHFFLLELEITLCAMQHTTTK